jgi:hypothetical protein
MQTRLGPVGIALALALLPAAASRADGAPEESLLETSAAPPLEAGRGVRPVDRVWLYNDPARVAAQGSAVAITRFTYSGGNSPTRPFAANVGTRGALLEAGGEVGLGHGLAITATGAEGQDATGSARTGAVVGVRWALLPDAPGSSNRTQLVLSGGVLRELAGSAGAWARLALGRDQGPARLAVSLHGERVFDGIRDSIDLMLTAGASWRLTEMVRAGVEYVGQDLEEAVADAAEGGARHIAGPIVSAAFLDERLSLVAGPAVAFGKGQGRLLGRLGLALQF